MSHPIFQSGLRNDTDSSRKSACFPGLKLFRFENSCRKTNALERTKRDFVFA